MYVAITRAIRCKSLRHGAFVGPCLTAMAESHVVISNPCYMGARLSTDLLSFQKILSPLVLSSFLPADTFSSGFSKIYHDFNNNEICFPLSSRYFPYPARCLARFGLWVFSDLNPPYQLLTQLQFLLFPL